MDCQKTVKKPTKTISGVAPISVMLPPGKCQHGVCLYCPSLNSPQSYTPESPAVLRARKVGYSPEEQVKNKLKVFEEMGHPNDKIELIIMGGTFMNFSSGFRKNFIKKCYDALNGFASKNLKQAKKLNEKAKHRCVALCIETRPDFAEQKQINEMLEYGVTRVELGVQAIDNKIYAFVNRGHTVKDVIQATERLKKAGFKIGYHIMPGLPLSNLKKDLRMFKKIFSDSRFKPDQLKIYPCQVIKGAGLEELYKKGKYKPYPEEETKKLVIKFLRLTPRYCRVMRIMREIPKNYLVAGISDLDLRHDIEEELRGKLKNKKEKAKISEIRFREIGFALKYEKKINKKIKKTEYPASRGKEIFLEAVNENDVLFGLLRLRLEEDKKIAAMIRELHVYGPVLEIGKHEKNKFQHKGLGKKLMKEAEKIAKKDGRGIIKVISGVGVREYYRKLGYKVDKRGIYMEKKM